MPESPVKILVIGGGISGLVCAWKLRQRGLPVILLERAARFGGVIDTVESDGFRFDIGPQSFLATPALDELTAELNLRGELLQADPGAPRYILSGGRLLRAPLGPGALLRSPLIGWATKLRFLQEPFGRSAPPDEDETIADFTRRKFGEDLLDNLVAPFVSGVYAGDPEKLSLASAFPGVRQLEERYGSVIRGVIKSRQKGGGGSRAPLCNFRNGITALTGALAHKLGDAAAANAEITEIAPAMKATGHPADDERPAFRVAYNVAGTTRTLDVAAIVVATPTAEAARLLTPVEPRFGTALSKIEYAGVTQVATGYRARQIAWRQDQSSSQSKSSPSGEEAVPRGFGFLVPRSEGLRILGTVWSSALFSGRAPVAMPDDQTAGASVSFTSFVGGATDPEICRKSDSEIAQIVETELSAILSITGSPVAVHVAKWPRALPQYNVGHGAIVTALKVLCASTPGIFLIGNYLAGPSLGACVEHAHSIADAVETFLGPPAPLAHDDAI